MPRDQCPQPQLRPEEEEEEEEEEEAHSREGAEAVSIAGEGLMPKWKCSDVLCLRSGRRKLRFHVLYRL